VLKQDPPAYADLIVEDITLADGNLIVMIRNVGTAPVTDAFWVDLYLDPSSPPVAVNQIWPDLGTQGAVWGVVGDALPLAPGDSLTLRVGDPFYDPLRSALPDAIPAGVVLYAQVDSYNLETTFGAVREGHEAQGLPYNNVLGPVNLTQGVALPPSASREDNLASSSQTALPWRGVR
jgi:hypothetical protein